MILIILTAAFGILKAQSAYAQTFFTAGPESLGDAGRAANVALDSHYLNPAALAFSGGSNIGTVYQQSRAQQGNPTISYAAIVTENDPDKFAAGSFGYLYRRQSLPNRTILDQDFSLDVSTRIVPTIAFGTQIHRLFRIDNMSSGFTKNNLSVGFLAVPRTFLGLALVAYDVLNDDDNDMVPVIAFGTHVIILDILRIRADVTRQEKKNPNHEGTLDVGVEFDLSSGFLLRTGGIWDNLNKQTYFTGGLSWEGPRLSLAYALKNNVNDGNDVTHTFQAWLNF